MSDLVENPEDRFSRVAAHLFCVEYTVLLLRAIDLFCTWNFQ